MARRPVLSRPVRAVLAAFGAALLADPVAAHAGSLAEQVEAGAVPSWLLVATGGVVIGGSFLFASLLTDHEAIAAVNGWSAGVVLPGRDVLDEAVGAAGVAALAMVVVAGFLGPYYPARNLAILWVWGGWWAGYTITVYALGNSWAGLNPWRTLLDWLGTLADLADRVGPGGAAAGEDGAVPARGSRELPAWADPWGSVAGLLGLVWLEVVSPVAGNPRFLALVVLTYTAATVAGGWVYGPDAWFRRVDPVARVFRVYGRLAPLQRTDEGVELKLPGTALTTGPAGEGEAPFVIALLWATTYDGLVATPAWSTAAWALLGDLQLLALPAYLLVLVGGYLAFLRVYRAAIERVRQRADTYVAADAIQRWFVPSLVPIAAGYHLAHYLGYFVSLAPALLAVLGSPLSAAGPLPTQSLPAWYGNLQLLFVVLGHLLAIYVAHAVSFDLFPGTLRPVRSQYPLVAVMVFYTMSSVWIITQPFVEPPLV